MLLWQMRGKSVWFNNKTLNGKKTSLLYLSIIFRYLYYTWRLYLHIQNRLVTLVLMPSSNQQIWAYMVKTRQQKNTVLLVYESPLFITYKEMNVPKPYNLCIIYEALKWARMVFLGQSVTDKEKGCIKGTVF